MSDPGVGVHQRSHWCICPLSMGWSQRICTLFCDLLQALELVENFLVTLEGSLLRYLFVYMRCKALANHFRVLARRRRSS